MQILTYVSDRLYFSVLLLFPLSITFFSLCTVFDSTSSKIDEVLLINSSTNVFLFGDLNVHYNDCLTYSGGTDRLVNSVIIFLSQMTLLRWLSFLLSSQTVIFTALLFWISFFLDTSVCSIMVFPPLRSFDVVVSASIDFPSS